MRAILLILFVQLGLSGCGQRQSDWCRMRMSIPTENEKDGYNLMRKMLFIDEKVGFLFGSCDTGGVRPVEEAVIAVTRDGGRNWAPRKFGLGEFTDYFVTDDGIGGILNSSISQPIDFAEVYITKDTGVSWQKLFEFKGYIGSIWWLSEQRAIMIADTIECCHGYNFFITNNGGQTWKYTESKYDFSPGGICYDHINKAVYYLDICEYRNQKPIYKCVILKLENFEFDEVELPEPIRQSHGELYQNRGVLYIAVTEPEGGVGIYQYSSEYNFKKISQLNTNNDYPFLRDIYVTKDTMSFLVGSDSYFVHFINYYTQDGGKTWKELTLSDPLFVSATAYYYDEDKKYLYRWIYATSENMQVPCEQLQR